MALRLDASGDMLTRTTTLPTITSFTMMAWVYISVDKNDFVGLLVLGDATGDNFYDVGLNSDGTTLFQYNPADTNALGSGLTVGVWNHIAITCAGSGAGNVLVYLNGVLNITAAGSSLPTAGKMWFGNTVYAEYLNGRLAACKAYSAILTANEILNEMQYFVPIRTANLNTWLPCIEPVVADNAIDFSGIGGNMTIGGTLAVEDGPPIVWAPVSEDVMGMAYTVAAGFPGVEGVPLFGSRVGVSVIPLPVMIPIGV